MDVTFCYNRFAFVKEKKMLHKIIPKETKYLAIFKVNILSIVELLGIS